MQVVERGLDDRMWKLLCVCWSENPEDRPSIAELVAKLTGAIHEPIDSVFVAQSEMARSRSSNKVEVHILMSSQFSDRLLLPHCVS